MKMLLCYAKVPEVIWKCKESRNKLYKEVSNTEQSERMRQMKYTEDYLLLLDWNVWSASSDLCEKKYPLHSSICFYETRILVQFTLRFSRFGVKRLKQA